MKIAFAASEAVPYCKTGGLADVVGALSHALAAKGHSVCLVLPLYKRIKQFVPGLRRLNKRIHFFMADRDETAEIWEAGLGKNHKVYFPRV